MKVLMIEHFLPDSIYTLELGRKLKKYCELTIICKKSARQTEGAIKWMPVLYPGGKMKLAAFSEYFISLLRTAFIIYRGRFDVLHIQDFKDIRFELPLYLGLRKHYGKLIYTVHNVLPHEDRDRSLMLYAKLYAASDALIVHNETSKEKLLGSFPCSREKIHVIPHGAYEIHKQADDERISIYALGESKTGKGTSNISQGQALDSEAHRQDIKLKKVFLQFGFIRKYKGIDILLNAIALIPEEVRKNLRFIIAGKQYEKLDPTDYKREIEELGIEEQVSFINEHIPEDRLDALFSKADFVLFPYRHIYGSGALLMAYTYGKPVIVSDISAFMEETDNGSTGLVFKNGSPEALAEAIVKAATSDDETIRLYASNISRMVEEKYNWAISAEKTAEIYKKLWK